MVARRDILISKFKNLTAFDGVSAELIETSRQKLDLTPGEFAENLGWSLRKYQRTLEITRERGFAERDVALAIRGLTDVLEGLKEAPTVLVEDNQSVFGGQKYAKTLSGILDEYGGWTTDVAPHLLRLLIDRAGRKKRITYGEAATTLEERELATRAWPRTAYGRPLGAICDALMRLGEEANIRVPLLSTIVVRRGGDPGDGFNPMIRRFIRQYEAEDQANELIGHLATNRDDVIAQLQQEVFDFPHWPAVLSTFELEKW